MHDLVENANDIIYSHDLQGRFTWVNAMATRSLGYSREELLRMGIGQIVHPEHLGRAKAMMAAKVQGGADRTPPYELIIVGKDGTRFWVEVSTRLLLKDGQAIGVQGVARDITDRKKVEASLVESERRYRSLVEGVPVGLFRTAPDGTILDANSALARIMGAPNPAALLGHNVGEFYARPEERQRVLEEADHQEAGSAFETEGRRLDGGAFWVRGSTRAVRDAQGRIQAYEGHVEDVSAQRIAEARAQLVQGMAMRLSQVPDFPTALALAVREVCQASGWAYGESWTLDAHGELRCEEAWFGEGAALKKFHHLARQLPGRPGEGLCGRAWADGRTVLRDDVQRDPDFRRAAPAMAAGLRTFVGVPVRDGSSTVALLAFMHPTPRPEDLGWVQMVEAIATQVGGAIARRKAEDRLRAQSALLEGQLENSPDGILAVAPDGSILAANRKLLEMCHVRPLAGHAPPDGWGGEGLLARISDPKRFLSRVRLLYETPGQEGDVVLGGRTYRRSGAPLFDADRLEAGRVWFFHDVTDERVLQQKLGRTR